MYIELIPTRKKSNRVRNYLLQSHAVRLLALFLAIAAVALVAPLPVGAESRTFTLGVNPAILNCLARFPNDPSRRPRATVTVTRGPLHDTLVLKAKNIKPKLIFDLFTVQNSNLTNEGNVDPNFLNFGLALYQSDVRVTSVGTVIVKIKTILLDEIFGFDPASGLAPTNTFHVGFWFDDPADAAACGFVGTTPFNGTHNAGPVAMISLPDPISGLGPLCTDPATCGP